MSLAPKWSKPLAELGLHLTLLRMEHDVNVLTGQQYYDAIVRARGRLNALEEAPDK